MCHFQVSSHSCWFPFFVIGCWQITGLPLVLPGPKSAMGPRTASSRCCWVHSVTVCGDSKIDGTHLHVILSDSIISLPQQTPRAFK
ncbi:unnamed protein product, partial [Staurois parvus]